MGWQKAKAARAGPGKSPKNGKPKREAPMDSDNDEFEEVRESQWLGKALRRQKTQEVAVTALQRAAHADASTHTATPRVPLQHAASQPMRDAPTVCGAGTR